MANARHARRIPRELGSATRYILSDVKTTLVWWWKLYRVKAN